VLSCSRLRPSTQAAKSGPLLSIVASNSFLSFWADSDKKCLARSPLPADWKAKITTEALAIGLYRTISLLP